MRKAVFGLMGLLCAFVSWSQSDAVANRRDIELSSDSIVWQIPQLNLSGVLQFSKLDPDGFFNNDMAKGQSLTLVLRCGNRREEFAGAGDRRMVYPVRFHRNGQTRDLQLAFWPDLSAGEFPEPYRSRRDGKVLVEVPEGYELAVIVASLAAGERASQWGLYLDTDYFRQVKAHFTPHLGHPLLARVKEELSRNGYLAFTSICQEGFTYAFNDAGELRPTREFRDFGMRVSLAGQLALWNDFARVSGFRQFYQQHQPTYRSFLANAGIEEAFLASWNWFDQRTSGRPNACRLVLSPLIATVYGRKTISANKFTETILFGHGFERSGYKGIGESAARLVYLGNYFMHIARDLVSETQWSRRDKGGVFADYEAWAEVGKEAFNATTPAELFREYFVSSLFLLYAKEKFPGDYSTVRYLRERNMNQRGYREFKKFLAAMEQFAAARDFRDADTWMPAFISELTH